MTVYILGGGPTGAALAQGLCDNDADDFVLIEREAQLGGMAQTLEWEGIGHHDLGPHKIFSLDKELVERVENLIPPESWGRRLKTSRIFHRGQFMSYPPGPFSMLQAFGWLTFTRMMIDFGLSKIGQLFFRKPAASFDEDLRRRLGATLYQNFFKPMAEKLWDDPKSLDVELSLSRVQLPSVIDILRGLAGKKKEGTFEALDFLYPRQGLQTIWDAIEKTCQLKGRVLLRHKVVSISEDESGIRRIVCQGNRDDEKLNFDLTREDVIFNTIPLNQLPGLFEKDLPPGIERDIATTLKLNDLYIVCLFIEEERLFQDSWIFVPDPAVLFHRVSEQASFSPEMVPRGSVVMCEVMDSATRPVANIEEHILAERCVEDLKKMGFHPTCRQHRVLRLPQSYPVYKIGFQEARRRVLEVFDSMEGFKTIGRAGAFQYIGTLDAMDIGFGAADWIASVHRDGRDAKWSDERQRTGFYPVLD